MGGDHHDHNHSQDRGHAHGHGHSHGSLKTEGGALRVVIVGSVVLALVAAVEMTVAFTGNSAGVLADGLHNLGDVTTTLALGLAFLLSRRAPSQRFPYGYHRGEDLAGLVVLLLIISSAVASGITSMEHLMHLQPVAHPAFALGAAAVGFFGNQAVAIYKTRAGKRLGSIALIADGKHSQIDGWASFGAALGVAGSWAGGPILDPIAGLIITAVIVMVAWEVGRNVTSRLLDAADNSLIDTIRDEAAEVAGVVNVGQIRARWSGRRIYADIILELAAEATLAQAHAIGEAVRHSLFHHITALAEVNLHFDPAGDTSAHASVAHHASPE